MLKATIIGNLGNDPDIRYAASGSPMLRFNVASNYRTRTSDGENQDRTEWVRVTVAGNRAETLSQYLRKGTRVYVSGRLEARPWIDRMGNIQAGLEVVAQDVEFFSQRGPTTDMDDNAPATASVADERPSRRMPQDVAVAGARGGAAVADRDNADLEDLPF
jgi:single-strand DNA-binding protein